MKKVLIILTLAIAVTGCNCYDVDEILLQRSDISFTVKGTDQFIYNPVTCQIACNSSTNEYRVYDDKIANWLIIRCNERPDTEGQTVSADLSWTTSSANKREKGLSFTVEKTDAKGYVWLWNKSKSIGIVIKNL